MMEKRVIIAIILCVGVLMAWSKLMPTPTPPPVAPGAASPSAPTLPSGATPPPAGGTASASPGTNLPEQELELSTPDVRFVFSTLGGTLKHAELRDAKFRDHKTDASGHDLVTTKDTGSAALSTTFPGATFSALGGSWVASRPSPDVVSFVAENAEVRVEKRYHADTTRYRLHLDVIVQNKTDRSQDHHLALAIAGRQD